MKDKIIAVSGGFDPLHGGHIDLLTDAARYGSVLVILNSDKWLERKKGKPFMCFAERKKVLSALWMVNDVVAVDDDDGSVCNALSFFEPDYFANGGDRNHDNTPELKLCKLLGITTLFGIGGEKTNSSSELLNGWNNHP